VNEIDTTTLGELTILRIPESTQAFSSPLKFFPDLDPARLEENRAWLEPHALDPQTGQLRLSFHSYVVRTPHHNVLIDTCIGNHKERPFRAEHHMQASDGYLRALAAAGLGVDDIDFVLCSHLHYDHVGWNTRLENGRWVPTFPKARYVFSRKEYEYWVGMHGKKPIASMTDSVLPVVEAGRADLVRNDHTVCEHVVLQPTPGHTPDHCAVRVSGRAGAAVFIGDVAHSPLQLRFPELATRADFDSRQAVQTRCELFERELDARSLVCTMHFPEHSAGRLERWDNGYRFEA
jgi:glyoxylase-like metal-dependent hydrolase (beta-lactamase superfamily II)